MEIRLSSLTVQTTQSTGRPAPSATPAAASLDPIFIEGFTGQTVIGIHHTELHDPQPVVIDLHAGLARSRACDTDRIADTIDYGVVRERLQPPAGRAPAAVAGGFAEAIADIPIGEFGARWVCA